MLNCRFPDLSALNMDLITIRSAQAQDAPLIRDLAYRTWFEAYGEILSQDQIRYMLDALYSISALSQLIENQAQQFVILYHKDLPQGFAAFGAVSDLVFKLHKIYVVPEAQGLGYGKLLIKYVIDRASAAGYAYLELNVNRQNKALSFYEKFGFEKVQEVDIPIGPYWMNDYIMRMSLEAGNKT